MNIKIKNPFIFNIKNKLNRVIIAKKANLSIFLI